MNRLRLKPGTIYLIVAALLGAIYAILWGAISSAMEHTFNLHIWDVGANFVLTNGSSPPGLDYGHLTWAPQNLIYLLFIPLVRVWPDPMVLVYAEDVLMGAAGVVIYLLAAHVWQSRPLGLLLAGLFLFNFSLFGAPFYPNHYEVLFSVFFPIAYLLHLQNHPAWATVALVLAAMCSSLGAVMAGFFIVLLLGPRFVSELRGRGLGLRRFFVEHRYPIAAGIACTAVFVFPFVTVGPAITLSYAKLAGSPASPDIAAGLSSYVEVKLAYLAFLAVPLVPAIARTRYALLALPYLALIVAAGSNHYVQFWYQYTYAVGGVLFVAYIEALRYRYSRSYWPRPGPSRAARLRPWRRLGGARRHREIVQATLCVVVLGAIALPYSPGNAWAGPYYSLPFHNFHLGSLTRVTTYDRALWDLAQRVPMNASVLIQEDMPMLTNRAIWYEPGSYNGEPVDFVVVDPVTDSFVFMPPGFIGPFSTPMIDWVNELHVNRSYGIVSEYQGAALLQEGYRGAPASFVAFRTYDPGVAFVGPNATYTYTPPGLVSITDERNSSASFRTGGLVVLPSGAYSLVFELRCTKALPSNHVTIGLWTNESGSPVALASKVVNGTDLPANGTWADVVVSFVRTSYTEGAYFAAYGATWQGTLSLSQVFLNQTAPA